MNTNAIFEDFKKVQNILFESIDQSARANLEAAEKFLELNKQRVSSLTEVASPSEVIARQSDAFKDYAEALSAHIETLSGISTKSREQLTELSEGFAKDMDFSSFFPFAPATGKTKSKAGSKSA